MRLNATQKNILLITHLTRNSTIKYAKHFLENQGNLDKISKEALSKISLIEYCKCFLFNKILLKNMSKAELKTWLKEFKSNIIDGFNRDDIIIHERFISTRNTEWAHSDENSFDINWYESREGIEIPITRNTDYILPTVDFEKIKSFSEKQIQNLYKYYYPKS